MKNFKSTKRALLTSVLSMVLCFTMLLGTTFAWFTDSVTSSNNIITAGNLDIELYYMNDEATTWTKVDENTNIFKKDALWEPGHTEVVKLKVVNEGSLALKYQLGVNIASEVGSKNVLGSEFKLSDHIMYGISEGEPAYANRDEAIALVKTPSKLNSAYSSGSVVLKSGESKIVTMVVYMPTSVGNEANAAKDAVAPQINLGINLFATQASVESDSFGTDYDKDAAAFSVDDAQQMLNENKDTTLANCVEPGNVLYIPEGYTGTLTLVDVVIGGVQMAPAKTRTTSESTTNIVILGDVVVNATSGTAIEGEHLNITGNGTLTAVGVGDGAYGIGGMNAKTITIEGITIEYAAGGHAYAVGSDKKYYKDAPEGGAAIGSGLDGAVITLKNVNVVKAIGGSKAAGIGARYHTGVTVNIVDSTIDYVEGGVSAAGIGSSRVSNGAQESATTINITNSTVKAVGGVYGAGIGSGYDTHCQAEQPMCNIYIDGSIITAQGGQYAAGVGTGYHHAALNGTITNSVVNATSGEKFYKATYTPAMDLGFGVVDPAREGKQTDSKLVVGDVEITLGTVEMIADSAESLKSLLLEGNNVCLGQNLVVKGTTTMMPDGSTTEAYGNPVGVVQYGGVFNGNGNKLEANDYTTYMLVTYGGTIKNLEIDNCFRGILLYTPTKDVIIDNVNISGDVCYAINTLEHPTVEGIDMIVTNSTIGGWTSFAGLESASFTNCKFVQGTYYTNVYGRLVKPYITTVFENCDFASLYYIDLSSLGEGETVTFVNCTVNGVKLTAENWKELVVAENECADGQISIEGKDGTYMSESNVFDYVIFK